MTTNLMVRGLTDAQHHALKTMAEALGTSINKELLRIIDEALGELPELRAPKPIGKLYVDLYTETTECRACGGETTHPYVFLYEGANNIPMLRGPFCAACSLKIDKQRKAIT